MEEKKMEEKDEILDDLNPFGEEEEDGNKDEVVEVNLITDKMVKKITYLIHKLAEINGKEYLAIQKKCHEMFQYENLARINKDQGHKIIDKLIELTGGEEYGKVSETSQKNEVETDRDTVTVTMQEAVRAAVDITLKEIVAKDVPVQGLGGVVLELSKVIFDAKLNTKLNKRKRIRSRMVGGE
jgi:hypothetical protein